MKYKNWLRQSNLTKETKNTTKRNISLGITSWFYAQWEIKYRYECTTPNPREGHILIFGINIAEWCSDRYRYKPKNKSMMGEMTTYIWHSLWQKSPK
jgi:hypothetical protein